MPDNYLHPHKIQTSPFLVLIPNIIYSLFSLSWYIIHPCFSISYLFILFIDSIFLIAFFHLIHCGCPLFSSYFDLAVSLFVSYSWVLYLRSTAHWQMCSKVGIIRSCLLLLVTLSKLMSCLTNSLRSNLRTILHSSISKIHSNQVLLFYVT